MALGVWVGVWRPRLESLLLLGLFWSCGCDRLALAGHVIELQCR
jgi:hypothetical protein